MNPRAPAVTAVRLRRVKPDAPVAPSVRRSSAVSLRTRPTDMPSTPMAITIPKTVAHVMMADDVGWSFFDSTEISVVDAVSWALLTWAAVKGWLPWTSQSWFMTWMRNSRTTRSVISVFGAEVPVGRAPTSSITGWARQWDAALHCDPPGAPGPGTLPSAG